MSEPLHSKEDGKLQASELWWSDHYEELPARGYRLRERYCKTAMDSWLVRNEIDDDEALRRGLMDYPDTDRAAYVGMDETQTTEGDRVVWIKRCRFKNRSTPSPSSSSNMFMSFLSRASYHDAEGH